MQNLTIDAADLTWLAGLARALVRDPQGADDLVQDTVVAALGARRVPEEGRRAWLGTVARRLAFQGFRGDGNRAARERQAARAEALPAAAELAEHAETAELVVSAARSLDEPYRRTILLRFMRGWSAEQIARADGIEADSVRRRVRRGLELMREELMRRDKRDWSAWCSALVPLTRVRGKAGLAAGAGGVTFGLSHLSRMQMIMFASVPLVGSLLLARTLLGPGPTVEPVGPVSPPTVGLGAAVQRTPAPVAAPRTVVAAATDGESDEPELALASEAGGGFVGRLLTPDGEPVADAPVIVRGFSRGRQAENEFGLPEDWVNPTGTTDAEGRFELRFDPPPAFQYIVEADAPGFGKARWRLRELDLEEAVDLGETLLVPAGSVLLRLVEESGDPFGAPLRVYVESVAKTAGPGGIVAKRSATYAAEEGTVLIEGVPEGPNTFRFTSSAAGNLDGGAFNAIAGETVEADWTYTGPDLAGFLRIDLMVEAGSPFTLAAREAAVLVREADGFEQPAGELNYDDLEPGTYTLRLDHPDFEFLERTGLQSGAGYLVEARGSASLELTVVSAATGEALEDYSAEVTYDEMAVLTGAFVLADGGVPEGGVFTGIVPRPLTLAIDAGEEGRQQLAIADLQPGERRSLTVAVDADGGLAVRVVGEESGALIPGWDLRAVPAVAVDNVQPGLIDQVQGWSGIANEQGLVQLDAPKDQALWIAVQDGAGKIFDARFEPEALVGAELELRVPEPATVSGTLNVPEPEQWGVVLRTAEPPGVEMDEIGRRMSYGYWSKGLSLDLDESGAFGGVLLLPGEVRLTPIEAGVPAGFGALPFADLAEKRTLAPGEQVSWSVADPEAGLGSVALEFVLDGKPAAGLDLRLSTGLGSLPVKHVLDGAGRLEAAVAPGSYRMELDSGASLLGQAGLLASPLEMLDVSAGAETVQRFELESVRRDLLVRFADGTPVLEGSVLVVPAHAPSGPVFGSGFGTGWGEEPRERWMAVGRYRVELNGEPRAEFDWGPGEGTFVVEI